MSELENDRWFNKCMEDKKVIQELIDNNTKMRAALLLIAEWKMPYTYFGIENGSNGERDHFKAIAKEGLQ